MRIAIMGFRGVPANYGGFETFVEELGPRLVSRGHEVTVYNRSNWIQYSGGPLYKGMRLVSLPSLKHKYFDTVSHTFLSSLHSLFQDYDAVLILNGANAPFCILPRLRGTKVALNVDGIERKRKKWNKVGRAYLRANERVACLFPNRIVSDAEVIQRYYQEHYGVESTMIPYGAEVGRSPQVETVQALGLEPEEYVLYVARLEPENNAHEVIEAFSMVETSKTLAIVGDAPYARDYIAKLKATTDPRVKFLGYVFGDGYKALQQSAFAYVQATEVGGTHPALLEGMAFGNAVICKSTPENREVLSDAGVYFSTPQDLAIALQRLVDEPEQRSNLQRKASNRILESYSWDAITDSYVRLFEGL